MTGRNRYFSDDFKCKAVRLSFESGKTIPEIATDLGVGKSTLTAWRRQFRDEAALHGPPEDDPHKELARLRHEYPVTDNVLDRAFTATEPNQKWGVDISYLWTAEG